MYVCLYEALDRTNQSISTKLVKPNRIDHYFGNPKSYSLNTVLEEPHLQCLMNELQRHDLMLLSLRTT